MWSKFRNIILVLSFFAVAFLIAYQVMTSDNVKVRNILVEGAPDEHKARILKRLTIRLGDPFWKIDLQKESEELKKDPWVGEVQLRRALPSTFVVNVTLKKPVALVGDKQGNFIFIDGKSETIDIAKPEKAPDLPLFLGENLVKDLSLRKEALEVFLELPEEGKLSKSDMSHVEYDSQKGFFITLQKSGIQVQLGHKDFAVRLDRARRVVQYLEANSINTKHIDADFSKKVLVQTKALINE